MWPVRTAKMETVYRGPTPEVGDLWCHRIRPGAIESVWEPDEHERELLAEGGRVVLTLYTEPIPPIMLGVVPAEDSEPVGEHPFKVTDEEER